MQLGVFLGCTMNCRADEGAQTASCRGEFTQAPVETLICTCRHEAAACRQPQCGWRATLDTLRMLTLLGVMVVMVAASASTSWMMSYVVNGLAQQ